MKLIEDSKNVSTVEKKTVNYNLDIDEIAIEDNDEEDEKNDGSKGDGPSPVNTLAMMMGKSVEANGHVLSLDDLTSNNKSKSSIAKKSLQNDMKTSIYDPYANNKETESCIICGETMLQSRPVDLFIKDKVAEPGRRELCCLSGHKYCVDCWSSHLLVQVNDNGLGCLPCPGYKCGEVLDLQWAPIMLKSQEYVNRLLAARHRQVIDCSGLKACPIENCGLLLHIPAVTGKKSTSKTLNPVEQHHPLPLATICDNGHAFCLSCFQQAHSPCSCADMQKWLQQVREETKDAEGKAEGVSGDDLANALWVAANTKRCPRCSTPIEKDEGCNHMRYFDYYQF